MGNYHFDHSEAEARIGWKVQALAEFRGVPRDTTGTVVRIEASADEYTLGVEWDLPDREQPLVHWFSRNEFERYLKEV
jgi:hypothetical protein